MATENFINSDTYVGITKTIKSNNKLKNFNKIMKYQMRLLFPDNHILNGYHNNKITYYRNNSDLYRYLINQNFNGYYQNNWSNGGDDDMLYVDSSEKLVSVFEDWAPDCNFLIEPDYDRHGRGLLTIKDKEFDTDASYYDIVMGKVLLPEKDVIEKMLHFYYDVAQHNNMYKNNESISIQLHR
jgi:hypothetical protein